MLACAQKESHHAELCPENDVNLPAVPEVSCNDLFPKVMHVEEPLEQLHWLLEARGAGARAGAGVDSILVNACTRKHTYTHHDGGGSNNCRACGTCFWPCQCIDERCELQSVSQWPNFV